MELYPMRYKDYVWPHNPKIYSISYERKIAVHKIPFGRYSMQDMGMTYRVLSGEGEFIGNGAYDEFKKLATVFYDGAPGILVHPVWQSASAYFVSLSLKQQPLSDYVSYTFEFWERMINAEPALTKMKSTVQAGTASVVNSTNTYTAEPGDSLWAIANRFGITLQKIIELNPQIKNPNLIYAGQLINIS